MPNTTNFNFPTPADTDLVKDGASAIRSLGNSIDTTFVDLKGGTTGQVLSKASNTDMDFTWVAQDDSNAIQNAIVDAKGDLISATAADTPARLAVGADGTYLQADSTTATGLKWGSVSAGGMTSLASGSIATSATGIDITSISGSYNELVLYVRGVSTTDSTPLRFRFDTGGTTKYGWLRLSTNSTSINTNTLDAYVTATESLASAGNSFYGMMISIPDYANTSTLKQGTYLASSGDHRGHFGNFQFFETGAITRIQILVTSGTFDAGSYVLYGVK